MAGRKNPGPAKTSKSTRSSTKGAEKTTPNVKSVTTEGSKSPAPTQLATKDVPLATSIAAFSFQYYKGFDQVSLGLAEPVTLLIGRNGAGKSNLLEGIALLGEMATGRPLFQISDSGVDAVRGGLAGCPSVGERWFVLACTEGELEYRLVIRPDVKQVEAESLRCGKNFLFQAVEVSFKNRTLHVRCNPAPAEPLAAEVPTQALSAERSVLSVYPNNFIFSTPALAQSREMLAVESLKKHLQNIRLLSPDPSAMRRYQRAGFSVGPRLIDRNAANLSALLHDLDTGSDEDKGLLRSICKEVQDLPEEPFGDIGFLTTPTDEVMLGFWPGPKPSDPDLAPPLHAALLSDGTLRYLAIVTALATLPEGTLLLIEDIDSGIHPSRMERLLQLLWERCTQRNMSAIVTTHNPAVLNGLRADHLRGVVVCYRDRNTQSSRICPLMNVPDSDVLMERGRLGDLVTKQVLEQHLAPFFSEDRKQKALGLLDSIP